MKTKVAKDAKATMKGTEVQMKATMDISQADFFKTTISLSRMPNTFRNKIKFLLRLLLCKRTALIAWQNRQVLKKTLLKRSDPSDYEEKQNYYFDN